MFSRLMPREGRFFELFREHAQHVVEGSARLAALMGDYGDETSRRNCLEAIDAAEKDADRVVHKTVTLLHRTFVTPLDREEIHSLITRADDILDLIQDVAESIVLYDLQRITQEAQQLAELSQLCCERVRGAIALLDDMDNGDAILKLCQEIDQIESDADRVMRAAMSRLFREESDVRQLIKLKAVYELLETITDKCEEVATIIEGVVLENA